MSPCVTALIEMVSSEGTAAASHDAQQTCPDISRPRDLALCIEWGVPAGSAVMRVRCICRKAAKCQPNFRKAVHPDPTKSCGPYKPLSRTELSGALRKRDEGAGVAEGSQEEDLVKRELLQHSDTGLPLIRHDPL